MKSNSKTVRDQAMAYLIECIMSPDYKELGAKSDSLTHRLENIKSEFRHWYCPYEQKRHRNIQTGFVGWMWGLPTCLPVAFESWEILELLTTWGLPNTNNLYSEDRQANLFCAIIYSELTKLLTKNNIQL